MPGTLKLGHSAFELSLQGNPFAAPPDFLGAAMGGFGFRGLLLGLPSRTVVKLANQQFNLPTNQT